MPRKKAPREQCCPINADNFPLPSATDVIHCWCLADSLRELLEGVRTADGPIFMPLAGEATT
jgi:hypothetical protein